MLTFCNSFSSSNTCTLSWLNCKCQSLFQVLLDILKLVVNFPILGSIVQICCSSWKMLSTHSTCFWTILDCFKKKFNLLDCAWLCMHPSSWVDSCVYVTNSSSTYVKMLSYILKRTLDNWKDVLYALPIFLESHILHFISHMSKMKQILAFLRTFKYFESTLLKSKVKFVLMYSNYSSCILEWYYIS